MKKLVVLFLFAGSLHAQSLYLPSGASGIGTSLTGNVGVGTSTPQLKFDVIGTGEMIRNPLSTGYSTLRLYNDLNLNSRALEIDYSGSAFASPLVLNGPSGESASITTTGNWPLTFGTANACRMTLRGSTLGIGTIVATNPSGYTLAVKGSIGATQVVVENMSWADFVFSPDYKLRPLKDVESFLLKNRRLPEIPSAKDVEEKGQDLGKMNQLLLMKVEELTLYLIDQQKQIAELKKSINQLGNVGPH